MDLHVLILSFKLSYKYILSFESIDEIIKIFLHGCAQSMTELIFKTIISCHRQIRPHLREIRTLLKSYGIGKEKYILLGENQTQNKIIPPDIEQFVLSFLTTIRRKIKQKKSRIVKTGSL